jgi:hypothetical protein
MPPATTIFSIAGLDSLRSQRHSLQARSADLVDGERAGLNCGETSIDGGLAGGILTEPGLEDAAHDALVNFLELERFCLGGIFFGLGNGSEAGAADGFADHKCA